MYDARCIVRLDKYTCSCGRWQLNGIPYPHACAAIYLHKGKPEKYVDACYKMEKYMEGYAPRVYGMEGPNTWPTDDPCDLIMPPIVRRAPSRPKITR
jgi:hypothetical protein